MVTVHAAPFIELYNSNFSERYGVHKLAGTSNATATLHWFWHNTYGWQYLENPPIQFNITRDTSEKTYTLNYYKNTTDTVTNMPVPNPQTEKSNTGMVTFTVSNARPSRDGYTFLGWAGNPDATTATVQPGNTITTPRETTNLYAVWESKTPPPEIPGDQKPNIEEANAKIRVQCIEYPSKHNPYTKNYRILPGSYDDLGWDRTEYGYIYSIRLNRAKYIAQFDQEIGRPHTDTEQNKETRINWRWENGAWHLIDGPDGVTADIKVKCAETPVKPEKPTALDGSFAIVCKNNEATHAYKADYIATPSQYTISDVQMDNQGYYVTATVTVAPNLAAYNNDTRVEHRLVDEQDATLTITFRYDTEATVDGNRKWKQQGDLPVVEVICKPKAPTADELIKLEMAVQVKCVVDASQQHTAAYGLLGECDVDYFVFEPRQEGDDWLCDISYYPERYVAEFNTTFQNLKHVQNDEKIVPVTLIWDGGSWQLKTQGRVHVTEVYTVTYTDGVDGEEVFADQVYSDLRKDSTTPAFNGTPTRTGYTFAGWEPEVAATVTQTVTYVAMWTPVEPKAPTAEELEKLEMAVQVKCVVDDSQQHTEAYGLLGEYDEDYFVGEPRKDGDDWLCDISYYPERYVAEFNTTFQNLKHVQNDEKIVPVTLIWDGGSWQLKTQGRVHVTEVYTVTYTDGVDGEEVFADQVYSDLRKDSTTPAFNGTPTRTGYTFAGWEPEVAATVTQTVTYVAMWTPVEPKAPTAEELEKLEMAVQVKCVVDDSQQHTEAYGLLGEYDEDYFVGEPRKDGDDWLCDISYYPERYVAEFNTTFQNLKHVQNDEKIVPVTLIWDGGSWQLKTQGRVHVTEVYTVTYTDGVDGEEVFADQVYSDLRKDSTTPAFNGTPTRTGYTFAGWEPEVAETVTQTVTYVAKWEKKTYKVVAKLYVNGKPAYYQNEDFYTYKVSGLYGENIDFDTIKAEAVEQAKQIKKASASYTAVILEDYEPNPVCTTFGEHQPGQATHYVKVNVKTEENVVIFQSFEGKTDLTKLHTTTAPYGTNVVEFLNGLGLDLDVAGYTLDTDEDGNTNWYKKDSPKWTFGANDTINGWTNVLLKYTITPHNIYAYLRTGDSIGDVLELNEATLNRLGLTKYNTEGFISIGTFVSNTLLTQDEYYGFDEDEAFLDVLAELQTKLVPETGVSLDKVGSKINWSWLYQPSDVDDRIAGYPTEDTDGYQLSGSLLLYGAKFEAGANDVTGMPTAAYGAYLDYFVSGESFNLPAPTRPGYDFKGWKIGNAVLTAGAAYTVDEDDMVFTAQWEARTDTPYTVEHYLENLDGSYALDTTEPLKGTTDTTVTAAAKSYDNFTYDSTVPDTVASGNIAGDGSLVLKLFYTRNTYDYTVRHIKQLPDGSYDEANAEVETLSGKFEALAAVTAKDYGSHYPTNDADTKQNIKIEKGLTIDVKYDLDEHTLTFETNGGSAINPVTVRHGNAVARPADPTKDKYTFIGWYADPEFTEEYDFATVLEADKTIYAKFELTSTPIGDIYVRYDVLHIKQLPDGTYDLANAEVEHLSAKKDTTVTAVIKDYRATHHVNVNRTLSKLTGTAIQPYMGVDGKPVYTILSVYYDLDFHTLTFDTMGGSRIDPVTVRHGNAVAKPKDPVNGGYIFDGWYTDKTYRTPYNFATPLTQDTTIYAKWFLIVLPGVTVKKNTPKLNTADHFAYVQGYPDGTVKPAGNITRAETAAILFRLMDEGSRKTYYSTKSGFRDVASGSWYNTYVATLNNAGVITDSSNGYFRPNEAITRAELAAMLAKFSETTGAANYFNDVSAKYWAANAIAICAKLGWINGYPDGTFRPDKNVTRAELMAMINRATGRAPKSADAFLPGMKTWIDNTSDKWYYLDVQEATNSHSYTVKGSETWTALTSDPNWSLYE